MLLAPRGQSWLSSLPTSSLRTITPLLSFPLISIPDKLHRSSPSLSFIFFPSFHLLTSAHPNSPRLPSHRTTSSHLPLQSSCLICYMHEIFYTVLHFLPPRLTSSDHLKAPGQTDGQTYRQTQRQGTFRKKGSVSPPLSLSHP